MAANPIHRSSQGRSLTELACQVTADAAFAIPEFIEQIGRTRLDNSVERLKNATEEVFGKVFHNPRFSGVAIVNPARRVTVANDGHHTTWQDQTHYSDGMVTRLLEAGSGVAYQAYELNEHGYRTDLGRYDFDPFNPETDISRRAAVREIGRLTRAMVKAQPGLMF